MFLKPGSAVIRSTFHAGAADRFVCAKMSRETDIFGEKAPLKHRPALKCYHGFNVILLSPVIFCTLLDTSYAAFY